MFDGGSKGTRLYVFSFKVDYLALSHVQASDITEKLFCELNGLITCIYNIAKYKQI